ncbi:hypothetical protein EJ110_NYTH50955 [Nymphaea thermarum]|nr:hypothetical protein EJ110_NYTH50955 [Nymphaea thermarum]
MARPRNAREISLSRARSGVGSSAAAPTGRLTVSVVTASSAAPVSQHCVCHREDDDLPASTASSQSLSRCNTEEPTGRRERHEEFNVVLPTFPKSPLLPARAEQVMPSMDDVLNCSFLWLVMKVEVETNMAHDTMKVDLENPMSSFQKVKVEYEELGADVVEEANQRGRTGQSLRAKQAIKVKKEKRDGNDTHWEADVVEEANQRRRTGQNLRAKQGIKVKKEKRDGNDTLWVNRALISNKAHGTGISGIVSFEHKCHLRRLLRKMMREQKWKGAAGVLSTLLKGTCKDYLSLKNRRKYWLWYAGIPEGLQLRTLGRHEAAAFSSSDVLSIHRSRSRPVEAPDSDNAIDNLKECASGYNSESSIGAY